MAITLATVETAIEAIQTGSQSFSVDGQTYTAASLDALIRLRDRLIAETGRSAATRPLFRAFGFRSMGYSGTSGGTSPTPVTGVTP